jgi:hypothetical protein
MNTTARLERDLTDWLSETAMPHTPDYADEILAETARTRQRPRWTFLGRWLPLRELGWAPPVGTRATLKAVGLLLLLALLLAVIAVVVGSRRTLPPPFGLAGNGLLSTAVAGDIVVVDPKTMATRTIVAHAAFHRDAHWSLDGTRLAFLRDIDSRMAVVIADADGRIVAVSEPFTDIDSDSVAWSPDGRQIAIGANRGGAHGIYLIDASTGAARKLRVPYFGFEMYWRPPDGKEILFRVDDAQGGGLGIASVAESTFVRVPTGSADPYALRPLGWTPDGRSLLFQQDGEGPMETVVVDVQTGAQTRLAASFGHVSNEGTRVAGVIGDGRLCVVPITGGPCDEIVGAVQVHGTHGASVRWSPDDRWIAISVSPVWLVDPTNAVPPREVVVGGPGSWQRIAP